jgi:SAM-dependent methyltransferase
LSRLIAEIVEFAQVWLGAPDPLLPPRELIDLVGGGEFRRIGDAWLDHFTRVGGLQPDHRVLDVGCGCGRMAVPLMKYLSAEGGYWGFDITPSAVRWCQRHIGSKRRNFHFSLADIYNKSYRPEGLIPAIEYRFPYQDGLFDFVFLTSVFTHMQPPELNHYLSEIMRVLKPGARCLLSFFLLNAEVWKLPQASACLDFKFKLPDCYAIRDDIPEAAVAFEEDYVRRCLSDRGLRIVEPIHFGSWCGRKQFLAFQDIVVAAKET